MNKIIISLGITIQHVSSGIVTLQQDLGLGHGLQTMVLTEADLKSMLQLIEQDDEATREMLAEYDEDPDEGLYDSAQIEAEADAHAAQYDVSD